MSYVLFNRKHEDTDREIYMVGVSIHGKPKFSIVPEYALAFPTARAAYDWAKGIPGLEGWRVGDRLSAGVLFGKKNLKLPKEEVIA